MRISKNTDNNLFALIGWILVCEMVGILGSTVTISAIPAWYETLIKPSFAPPNWVFGPVWTLLYALMGIGAYLVSRRGMKKPAVRWALALFVGQLFLNFIWSFIFFGARNIPFAFVDIAALWVVLIFTLVAFERVDKIAALLLVPYLFWVSFAMILNYSLWMLNG